MFKPFHKYKIRENIKDLIKKNFFLKKKNNKNDGLIIVEFAHWTHFHLTSLYLLNSLIKIYNSKIIAFYNSCYLDKYMNISLLKKLQIFFLKVLKLRTFKIYSYLQCSDLIYPNLSKKNRINSNKIFLKIIKSLNSKQDILKIRISKIKIGDLIYDSYLKRYKKITIDHNSDEFRVYLKLFIDLFIFWENFFKIYKVNSVISSHSVYSCGVPARIALRRNIKVFIPNINFLYQLNKKQQTTDIEFLKFKSDFKKYFKKSKKEYLLKGKETIEKRFQGNFDKNIYYSTNKTYKKRITKNNILKKKGFNILIAAHSFSDAPHVYGELIFPDFKEWLYYLGNLSNKTNYNWYIKDNPDYPESNKIFIKEFIKTFPKIKQIPSDTSHHFLKKKVNLLLTCYGTIAHEYAFFGIPVINASINNPHVNYNFCFHPENVKSFQKLILNAKNLRIKINKKEIFEYIFMRYVLNKSGYLINLDKFFKKNLYKDLYNLKLYEFFLKNFDLNKHNIMVKKFDNFVKNKKYIYKS